MNNSNYFVIFGLALILNVVVTFRSSDWWERCFHSSSNNNNNKEQPEYSEDVLLRHSKLLRRYLIVYLLATLADWLQGAHVYALYAAYEYSHYDIAILFVAGFGSSMVFGSFVGGMSDQGGRRLFVIVYAIVYAGSCITKHFSNFYMLVLGRLLGGIATSLLCSVFETWLIRAHGDANLPQALLSKSFSWAAYGNSIVAIVAGVIAEHAAGARSLTMIHGFGERNGLFWGGFISPFDISMLVLMMCGFAAAGLWEENYGEFNHRNNAIVAAKAIITARNTQDNEDDSDMDDDDEDVDVPSSSSSGDWYQGMYHAFTTAMRNTDILLCGMISSLFEGSMYILVFMWTPTLQAGLTKDEELPFGIIFATFMVCCMAGSSVYSILIQQGIPGESMAVGLFAAGALSMSVIAASYNTNSKLLAYLAMNVFEFLIGMYFPVMGTMKGAIVPEDQRAAIYNLNRIPLNMIVLMSLLTDLSPKTSYILNSVMLLVATWFQDILRRRREKHVPRRSESMEERRKNILLINPQDSSVTEDTDEISEVDI